MLSQLTHDWKATLDSMEAEEKSLNSEIVLAASYSVYMGPYNSVFRKTMLMKYWSKCLIDRGMKLEINGRSDVLFSMTSDVNNELIEKCEMKEEEEIDSYRNYLLLLLKLLVGEELCRHWLTLNFSLHDLENLAIVMAPLKRALFVVDPNNKLEHLIDQMTLPDQTVVELDVSQR